MLVLRSGDAWQTSQDGGEGYVCELIIEATLGSWKSNNRSMGLSGTWFVGCLAWPNCLDKIFFDIRAFVQWLMSLQTSWSLSFVLACRVCRAKKQSRAGALNRRAIA